MIVAVAGSAVLGAALALATDQGGDARTTLSRLRNAVGSLSTPWILIAFLAGTLCLRIAAGTLLGLATTISALCGWYLCATLVEDLGGHGFLGDLRLEFAANRIYFLAGLVSGPVFGALGSWWRRSRTLPSTAVAGALLMGEPLVMAGLTALHASGVLHYGSRLPSVAGVVANTAVPDIPVALVLVGEFLVGLATVLVAVRASATRPGGAC
jgi:hypothetical protein